MASTQVNISQNPIDIALQEFGYAEAVLALGVDLTSELTAGETIVYNENAFEVPQQFTPLQDSKQAQGLESYTVIQNQNIVDLGVQLYGKAEDFWRLITANSIESNVQLDGGDSLQYMPTTNRITKFFRGQKISTGELNDTTLCGTENICEVANICELT